jgi:glycopeptide antibiotics resistance protein
MLSWKFFIPTFLVIGVILHGSLYPYDFHVPTEAVGPFTTLLQSWAKPPSSYGDLLANVLLYVPFGFFGALSIRIGLVSQLFLIILVGFLISFGVELVQYYDVGRVTNMSDVYLNTLGATFGALAAMIFGAETGYPLTLNVAANPIPAMLVAAMLGYHLYPYVPTIDAHKYWESIKPLIVSPKLAVLPTFRYIALWLTTSALTATILRSRAALFLFIVSVFASKIIIEDLVVTLPEVLGAGLAFAIWLTIGTKNRYICVVVAVVLGGSIIVGRLEPFEFQATSREFGWLPFRGFLDGSVSVNIMAFMEKCFLYGSLIWFLTRVLLSLWLATLLTASLLFVTSVAEIYLPGRSAEITDAVMALMMSAIIYALRLPSESRDEGLTHHNECL